MRQPLNDASIGTMDAAAERSATGKLEPHPAACILPCMKDQEFADLIQSMQRHGYDVSKPIILHEGKILDGRNRYQAAIQAGVELVFADWEPAAGDTPMQFVLRTNLTRRHLSESQKAFVALEAEKALAEDAKSRQGQRTDLAHIKEKFPEGRRGQARDQAAVLVGISGHYVSDAKKIQEAAPELADQVRRGQLTIPQARSKLREQQQQIKTSVLKILPAPLVTLVPALSDGENGQFDLDGSIASVCEHIAEEIARARTHNKHGEFLLRLLNWLNSRLMNQ